MFVHFVSLLYFVEEQFLECVSFEFLLTLFGKQNLVDFILKMPASSMFGHGVEFSFEVTALYQALEHVLLLHFFPLFVNFEFDQIFNGRFLFELEGFQSAVWALVVDLFDV